MSDEERFAKIEGTLAAMAASAEQQTKLMLALLEKIGTVGEKVETFDDSLDALLNNTDEFTRMEQRASVPLAMGMEARGEAGVSGTMALILSKIDNGIDLTPQGFDMPSPSSYFSDSGFREAFMQAVTGGKNERDAYESTCLLFGKPPLKKKTVHDRIVNELPEKAGGAFRLSRGEYVAQQAQGILGPSRKAQAQLTATIPATSKKGICGSCQENLHDDCAGVGKCVCVCPE